MRTLLPLLLCSLFTVGGCSNSCQQICTRMARYAEECGHTVSNEEIRACKQAQAGSTSRDDRAICRQLGDPASIREEWSCDDLDDYWARTVPDGNRIGVDTSDTGKLW